MKSYGYEQPVTVYIAENLAQCLVARREFAKAEPLYRDAVKARDKMLGTDNPDYANVLNNLGTMLVKTDRINDGEPLLQRSVALRPRRRGRPFLIEKSAWPTNRTTNSAIRHACS